MYRFQCLRWTWRSLRGRSRRGRRPTSGGNSTLRAPGILHVCVFSLMIPVYRYYQGKHQITSVGTYCHIILLYAMKISGLPTSSSTRAWAWRQRGCCWYRWGPEIMDSSHPTFSSLALDCLFWVKTTQGRWSFWSRTVILSFGLLVLGRGSWSHGLSVLLPFHSSAGHV